MPFHESGDFSVGDYPSSKNNKISMLIDQNGIHLLLKVDNDSEDYDSIYLGICQEISDELKIGIDHEGRFLTNDLKILALIEKKQMRLCLKDLVLFYTQKIKTVF